MKLTHKIGKLFSREGHQRGWRRFQRKFHPIPLQPLLAKIDPEKLREIRQRYANSPRQVSKYADVERWLKTNIERVQDLGLNRGRRVIENGGSPATKVALAASQCSPGDHRQAADATSSDILDLGCGGGFFLFICQQLGHCCLGLDLDEFPLYGELVDLLGVERRIWEIRTLEPLPDLGRKFDWITAFSIGFNRKPDKTVWGPNEWDFFLKDLKQRHLKPGGNIFLGLNPQLEGAYYTAELGDFFLAAGAEIERERVLFRSN